MGGWGMAIYEKAMAEGRAKGMAKVLHTYMRKTGATLHETLDFFKVGEEERPAIIARIEERDAVPEA